MKTGFKYILLLTLSVLGVVFLNLNLEVGSVSAQQPTGELATVTSTPEGPFITVIYDSNINVRSGPHSVDFPIIGTLVPGQTAPALGRTPGGEWIEIYYPGVPGNVGWVYATYVTLSGGVPPVIPTPVPPTPITTPTINPALITALAPLATPTRLPTFTAAPPLILPVFTPVAGSTTKVPMGLVILALTFIGIFGGIVSFLRKR